MKQLKQFTEEQMAQPKPTRTLHIEMKDCCCYSCGAGSVRTYEKERLGLDPKTWEADGDGDVDADDFALEQDKERLDIHKPKKGAY